MGDYLSPRVSGKPERKARGGYALAVIVAGAVLVVCAILPWAGVEARVDLLGAGVAKDVRGVDGSLGVYTLLAGLVAVVLGAAGLMTGKPWAVLAALPGLAAMVLLVTFVAAPQGLADRVSVDLGVLSIAPVIRFGWFGALASALAVVAFGVLSWPRRRRR
ncbi:hypothetical protein [Nonomuraea typhae]|uniref:hypothetical protein n=1 Tax=Nonomuraea typhae TaxID=2603600 RepID=UPI0012F9CB4B|nr:hypothetical protein [Nonomuraea typhae]